MIPRSPAEILAGLALDPTRPRVTWYDDSPGPTRGERIELSARVFRNWVAKGANFLVSELDLEPGDPLSLAIPPHWRQLVWAFAGWVAEAEIILDPQSPSWGQGPLLSSSPDQHCAPTLAGPVIAVPLPSLARSWPQALPAGVIDGAAALGGQADEFFPMNDDLYRPALELAGRTFTVDSLATAAASLAAEHEWTIGVRLAVYWDEFAQPSATGVAQSPILPILAAWQLGGSVVFSSGATTPEIRTNRDLAERVTAHWP